MLYNYYIFSVKHFYHELLIYVQPLPVQRLKNNVTLILLYNITIITIIPIFYFNKYVKYIHVPFFFTSRLFSPLIRDTFWLLMSVDQCPGVTVMVQP